MENILVAAILIFILLFGGMTLSQAVISAQQTLMESSQSMDSRAIDVRDTSVSPADLRVINSGNNIDVLVRNTGSAKLTDFDRWDVFVDYFDDTLPTAAYHTDRLTYDSGLVANNSWAPGDIYIDFSKSVGEAYEAGILNPGEEMLLHVKLSPAVGVGQSAQVTVSTDNGVTMSTVGLRNVPPTLPVNTGFKVANLGTARITSDILLAQDTDNTTDELTFTVTTPPAQGTLDPATGFTQAQIDNDEVTYQHTGAGNDSFEFTVSDGIDTIGPYTANITINQPLAYVSHPGLVLNSGTTSVITNGMLEVTDADDPANQLTYRVTQFPANGSLSLGGTFTQDDINNGLLSYTSFNTNSDIFQYVVTDGYDVIGTYTFTITVVP